MACNCEECTCCWESSETVQISGDGTVGGTCLSAEVITGDCGTGNNLLKNLGDCGGTGGLGVCIDTNTSNITVVPSPNNPCSWSLNYGNNCLPGCACDQDEQYGTVTNVAGGAALAQVEASITNDSGCTWSVLEVFSPQCNQAYVSNATSNVVNWNATFNYPRWVNGAFDNDLCSAAEIVRNTFGVPGYTIEHSVAVGTTTACHILPPGDTLEIFRRVDVSMDNAGVLGTSNFGATGGAKLTLFATSCGQ